MGLLDQVKCDKKVLPPSIVVFGGPGIGKTKISMDAPDPIFIATDMDATKERGGANRLPIVKSREDVFAQVEALITDKHEYKTLVIDDLSGVSNLFEAGICADYNKNHIGEVSGGFGKGERYTADVFLDLLALLDTLRVKRKMAVILIAHSEIKTFSNPEGDSYDRHQPELNKNYAEAIIKWCDVLAFARNKIFTTVKGERTPKAHSIAVGKGERVLMMQEQPAFKAKTRFNHAAEIPMSWAALSEGMK